MSYDAFEPIGFGKEIFKQRYAIHPEETWDDACRRIASFIASAERNGKRLEWEERFYRELVSNRFIPGGRIMYGAGRAKAALINCFHKNSPVVTERGVLPITEVEIGDRVLTHDGTFQKVVNKFDQGVRESLLNITIDRMPKNSLQVTPEHKIMTKRGWVEAQNLTKDDFVSIAGYKDSFEVPTEINVKDYITLDYDLEDVEGMLHKLNVASGTTKFSNESGRNKYSQQIVPIKSSIPVNEDLFKLLGYYISEGCAAKTSPVVLFTFSKKETGYVEEVVSLCGSLFGVEAVVRDYKSWVQVVISSNLLNNFLTNFIGSSFDSKILPWWILNCPEEWRLTLLAYACRGDSHTDKKTGSTNLVMCNPHVMQQLFFIAQELGLAYSFKTLYKKEERHSTPYGLYISKVGCRDNIFSQFLDKLGHDVVYNDDPYWRKVLSVEEVPYNDVVWDISVDKNHSLQINGIVASNCFVIGSDDIDSREGWAKNLGDMLIISGLGGGVGINFCMSPESRVLTQDLKWVRIDSLKPQDKLIGLDEETDGSKGRHLRSSTVLACSPTKLPSVSIKTEKGEMLVSETHPILARKIRKNYKKSGQGFNWVMAKDLTSDYELAFATEPWEIEKKDELLWLGGLLDGEGCLSQRTRRNRVGGGIYNAQLSIGQNIGPVFDGIGKVLDRMGVKYGVYKNSNNSCYQYVIGSKWDAMRVLSSCPTIRLSELKNSVWEGAKIYGKEANHVRVQSVEFVGEQELIAIQTSTKTFIAEGFFQHNSDIRPRGTKIHGTGGEATGAVSFMELINNIGEVIKGGGGRRSALMECLNIDHPDIIEFIDKKFVHIDLDLNNSEEVVSFVRKNLQLFDSEVLGLIKEVCTPDAPQQAKQVLSSMVKVFLEKNLRNANVSVVFNDDPEKFFEKVRNKEMHQLKWKGQVVSEIRADKLWDKIITNALAGGEPGILNMYLANKASNISNVGPLVSTNPCGEIAMTPHEVCDLAHIVLPRFIRDNGQVDWASLADTITAGIRFLDNVLDVTTYPTEEIKVKATNTRRLGLGITGLHDALLLMGLKYSSEEGRDTAAKIMKFIKNKSYEESVFLAAERGVYGFYDHEAIKQSATYRSLKPSVRHQIDERGLRNCALNTIAPCGTNSIVSGVSSSAEPIMGPAYERMWWVGDEKNSEVVIHPLFEQFVIEGKDVSHFEYAEEIDPKDHLRMQAALQEHIDNAISKTIAIPSTYSKKQFSEDLMEFMPILKGITVYPIGSRGESPIKPLSIEKAIKVVKERIGRVGTSQEQENQDCPNGVCSLG